MPNADDELALAEQPLPNNRLWEWLKRAVRIGVAFVAHQVIGTLGVMIAARVLLGFVSDFAALAGRSLSSSVIQRILYGNPYYPLQIALALTAGFLISRRFRHRSMLFVWILPFLSLGYAFVANSTVLPRSGAAAILSQQTRFPHFFGWGCRMEDHCVDQSIITLPFYTAALYSIGALLARKKSETSRAAMKIDFSFSLAIGLLMLAGATIELLQLLFHPRLMQQMMQGFSWPWLFTAMLFIAGVGVIGGCLVRSAYRMRHQLRADDDESESSTQADDIP